MSELDCGHSYSDLREGERGKSSCSKCEQEGAQYVGAALFGITTTHTKDRAIADDATEGEWEIVEGVVISQIGQRLCTTAWSYDATFIAHFDPPKIRALLDEIAKLTQIQYDYENAEAECCPEDHGGVEWVGILTKRLDEARAIAERLADALRDTPRAITWNRADAVTIAKWSKP